MEKARIFLQFLILFSLFLSCNFPKGKESPNLLHLSQLDFKEFIKMGYILEEGEDLPKGLSQEERIAWLFKSSKPPGSYLRYRNNDSTSVIFLNENNEPQKHMLCINFQDSVKLEHAFQALVENDPVFTMVETVNSENKSCVILDEITNQYKSVNIDLKGLTICISHPIGL